VGRAPERRSLRDLHRGRRPGLRAAGIRAGHRLDRQAAGILLQRAAPPELPQIERAARLAIGASCAAAVAGGGGWLITHERSLSDVERAIRHRSPSEAWTAIKRHAATGWAALEARLPFDLGKPERSAATPSRPAVRDSTASHATQHRAKKTGKRGRTT